MRAVHHEHLAHAFNATTGELHQELKPLWTERVLTEGHACRRSRTIREFHFVAGEDDPAIGVVDVDPRSRLVRGFREQSQDRVIRVSVGCSILHTPTLDPAGSPPATPST